jgi:hypothetical protein
MVHHEAGILSGLHREPKRGAEGRPGIVTRGLDEDRVDVLGAGDEAVHLAVQGDAAGQTQAAPAASVGDVLDEPERRLLEPTLSGEGDVAVPVLDRLARKPRGAEQGHELIGEVLAQAVTAE